MPHPEEVPRNAVGGLDVGFRRVPLNVILKETNEILGTFIKKEGEYIHYNPKHIKEGKDMGVTTMIIKEEDVVVPKKNERYERYE